MGTGRADFKLAALAPEMAEACAGMTFPAYHHLLSLEPTPRHPGQGDTTAIQPVGVVALSRGALLGLALAECPLAAGGTPEVLSLFVHPDRRGQGLGTALLAGIEEELARRGFDRVQGVYMTGKPAVAALERVLWKRHWEPPQVRTVSVRFTPEEAATTPWYGRVHLGPEFQVFPWSELDPDERARLERSNQEAPWIAAGLEPWRHDRQGFDTVSSVGLRYHGQVVGWVINHRIAPNVVRFTCSFMRQDLARRARILPLYTASIERLRGTECAWCTFITPVDYPGMVEFVQKHCARFVSFVGETRGSSKRLVPADRPGGRQP